MCVMMRPKGKATKIHETVNKVAKRDEKMGLSETEIKDLKKRNQAMIRR